MELAWCVLDWYVEGEGRGGGGDGWDVLCCVTLSFGVEASILLRCFRSSRFARRVVDMLKTEGMLV